MTDNNTSSLFGEDRLSDAEMQGALMNAMRERISALLKHCGDAATCAGCGAAIFWMRHLPPKVRRAPYNPDGVNHFVTCPHAEAFKGRYRR